MTLDEGQRKKVSGWIAEGLKLSEIQNRLASELGVRLTYMEVRLLVDDLKLTPKDPEPAQGAEGAAAQPAQPPPGEPAPPLGGVSVSVDQLARPGTVVSGKVIFSDGVKAEWYFDQTGRLAVSSPQAGYRPNPQDLQKFQAALDGELSKMGF